MWGQVAWCQDIEAPHWLLVLDAAGGVQGVCVDGGTVSVPIRPPDMEAPPARRLVPTGTTGFLLLSSGSMLPLGLPAFPIVGQRLVEERVVDVCSGSEGAGAWLLDPPTVAAEAEEGLCSRRALLQRLESEVEHVLEPHGGALCPQRRELLVPQR